jgi:hypothetical protein
LEDLEQWSKSYDHCALLNEEASQLAYLEIVRQVWGCAQFTAKEDEDVLTLNANVYVILGLLCLSCIFVRFCERVCEVLAVQMR